MWWHGFRSVKTIHSSDSFLQFFFSAIFVCNFLISRPLLAFSSLEILLLLFTFLFPRACKTLYAALIVPLFYLLFCFLCALILRSFLFLFRYVLDYFCFTSKSIESLESQSKGDFSSQLLRLSNYGLPSAADFDNYRAVSMAEAASMEALRTNDPKALFLKQPAKP